MKAQLHILCFALASLLAARSAFAQATAFTYQGRLTSNGGPANGNYDFTFSLFNDANSGAQVGYSVTNTSVSVTNGEFTTLLDFSSEPWNGQSLWLDIFVRTNGNGVFTELFPRQPLTPAPYAIHAAVSTNVVGSFYGDVTGTQTNMVIAAVPISALPANVVLTNGPAQNIFPNHVFVNGLTVPDLVNIIFGTGGSIFQNSLHSGGGPGGIETEMQQSSQGSWSLNLGLDGHHAATGQLGTSMPTHEYFKLQYDFIPSSYTNYDNVGPTASGLWGYSKALGFALQTSDGAAHLMIPINMAFRAEADTNDGKAVLRFYSEFGRPNGWNHTTLNSVAPYSPGNFSSTALNWTAANFTNNVNAGSLTVSGNATANSFSGNGSNLLHLQAANIEGGPGLLISGMTNLPGQLLVVATNTGVADNFTTFNGGNLTNLQTTNLSGTIPGISLTTTNINGEVSVLDYGAAGDGATDDTLAFQAALASGHPVFVPPWRTNGYVVGGIILSNNTLRGDPGSRLIFKPGATYFCVQFAPAAIFPSYVGISNTWGNSGLIGLELDGGGGTNIPASVGNRHGVWVDPFGANNRIMNCYVHGFSGYGVLVSSTKPSNANPPYLTNDIPHLVISGVESRYNYFGFYYPNGSPTFIHNADSYTALYQNSSGLKAEYNQIGLYEEEGNQIFSDSIFSYNMVNLFINDNDTGSHESFIGCILNHPGNSPGVICSNVVKGVMFVGCQSWFSDWYLTNCAGVTFTAGEMDSANITVTNGTANRFYNNLWYNAAPAFSNGTNTPTTLAYFNDPVGGSSQSTMPWNLMPATLGTVSITNANVTTGTFNALKITNGAASGSIATGDSSGNITWSTAPAINGANVTNLNASNLNIGVVSVANGGTGASTAFNAGSNIGAMQMSPVGGNNSFADMSNAVPAFKHQIGLSYFGNNVPSVWVSGSTGKGDWKHPLAFNSGIQQIGDPKTMGTNSGGEIAMYVNGVSDLIDPTNAPSVTVADNVVSLENENPYHYSAMRWKSAASDGQGERGAVGYGNSLSVYSQINYLEDYGNSSGFYFVGFSWGELGGKSFGMENYTGDFVKYSPGLYTNSPIAGSNVVFRVDQTGATTMANNLTVNGQSITVNGAQVVATQGGSTYVNSALLNPNIPIKGTNFISTVSSSSSTIGFDVGANGTGIGIVSGGSGLGMFAGGTKVATWFSGTPNSLRMEGSQARLIWATDGGGDIGAAGASRPANLWLKGGVSTKTASQPGSYSVSSTDSLVLITSNGGTATLPDVTTCSGHIYTIKLAAAGTAAVATTNGQTIDGSATYALSSQYKYVTVQGDGSQWWVIANN